MITYLLSSFANDLMFTFLENENGENLTLDTESNVVHIILGRSFSIKNKIRKKNTKKKTPQRTNKRGTGLKLGIYLSMKA